MYENIPDLVIEMIPDQPIEILAPAFALVVAYLFFYEGMIYNVGKDNAFWSTVRSFLPFIDDQARDVGFYTNYTVSENELAGRFSMDTASVVNLFYGKGFIHAPLAAHKEDWEGRNEVASLAHYGRDGSEIESWDKLKRFVMMAFVIEKQLHVTLFEDDNGDVIVTAHYEDSPYNALRAYKHLRGKNYDVERGVEMVRGKLAEFGDFEVVSEE